MVPPNACHQSSQRPNQNHSVMQIVPASLFDLCDQSKCPLQGLRKEDPSVYKTSKKST